jgi:hypothetical protein
MAVLLSDARNLERRTRRQFPPWFDAYLVVVRLDQAGELPGLGLYVPNGHFKHLREAEVEMRQPYE